MSQHQYLVTINPWRQKSVEISLRIDGCSWASEVGVKLTTHPRARIQCALPPMCSSDKCSSVPQPARLHSCHRIKVLMEERVTWAEVRLDTN